jgi:hypothetical protein
MEANRLLFMGIVILPYVFIAVGFFFVFRVAYRSNSQARPLFFSPLICSLIITSSFIVWGDHAIITSRSSTAAIGYIFLPFYSIAVAVAGFLFSWSFLYLGRFVLERLGKISNRLTSIPPLVLALLILSLTGFIVQGWVARHKLLNATTSASTDAESLEKILAQAISSRDLEVMSKLAKNSNTSISDLLRIFDSCKHNVADFNPPEYIVYYSLAQNPQTPPDILVVLAKCQQSTIRLAVGMNPSTPTNTLFQLSNDKVSLVRTWLTSNPKIPKELLLQLANDPDKIVRSYAETYLRSRGYDK